MTVGADLRVAAMSRDWLVSFYTEEDARQAVRHARASRRTLGPVQYIGPNPLAGISDPAALVESHAKLLEIARNVRKAFCDETTDALSWYIKPQRLRDIIARAEAARK